MLSYILTQLNWSLRYEICRVKRNNIALISAAFTCISVLTGANGKDLYYLTRNTKYIQLDVLMYNIVAYFYDCVQRYFDEPGSESKYKEQV